MGIRFYLDEVEQKKCAGLNTGSVSDTINHENDFFAEGSTTVIRKSSSSGTSPNQWNGFEVTTNPVNDTR